LNVLARIVLPRVKGIYMFPRIGGTEGMSSLPLLRRR